MKVSKSQLAQIMKNAWAIAKKSSIQFGGSSKQYLSGALKMAWNTINDAAQTIADKMIAAGGKLWTSKDGKVSRVYLNDDAITSFFGFKKVSEAKYKNEFRSIGKAKVWFDCKTETMHSDVGMVRVMFRQNDVDCKA